MSSSDRSTTPCTPGRVRRPRPAPLEPGERRHLTQGPVTGEQARRLLVRVQQTSERRRRPSR
jgi:hypothetical protein